MQSNQPGRTSTEVALVAAVQALGMRPIRDSVLKLGNVTVKPDLVFPKQRLAAFVHGCFWHACPRHASWPRRNGTWWRRKLAATVQRDRRQLRQMRRHGWSVITIWEHEPAPRGANRVHLALLRRTTARSASQ